MSSVETAPPNSVERGFEAVWREAVPSVFSEGGDTVRVLIVDDDPDICLMMSALFGARGWETDEVMSGSEALTRVDDLDGFDVLVIDYKMPGMTGIDLVRKLRGTGIALPMIMCSAYLDPEIELEAQSLGVPTVSKADLNVLIEVVQRHAQMAA